MFAARLSWSNLLEQFIAHDSTDVTLTAFSNSSFSLPGCQKKKKSCPLLIYNNIYFSFFKASKASLKFIRNGISQAAYGNICFYPFRERLNQQKKSTIIMISFTVFIVLIIKPLMDIRLLLSSWDALYRITRTKDLERRQRLVRFLVMNAFIIATLFIQFVVGQQTSFSNPDTYSKIFFCNNRSSAGSIQGANIVEYIWIPLGSFISAHYSIMGPQNWCFFFICEKKEHDIYRVRKKKVDSFTFLMSRLFKKFRSYKKLFKGFFFSCVVLLRQALLIFLFSLIYPLTSYWIYWHSNIWEFRLISILLVD